LIDDVNNVTTGTTYSLATPLYSYLNRGLLNKFSGVIDIVVGQ